MSHRNKYVLFCILVWLFSCSQPKKDVKDKPHTFHIPVGFKHPDLLGVDSITDFKVKIGKRMFFDKNLSSTKELSCASCHIPSQAFSDTIAISDGVLGRKGFRNAPSLANVAYQPVMFVDGGSPTIEMQVVAPITDSNGMNMDYLEAINYLANDSIYRSWSMVAYGRVPDAYVFTRSIAAYQRTLLSGDAKYDQVVQGDASFTEEEQRGYDLFFSDKTNCSSCHSGNLFTNYTYQNIGLYTTYSDSGRMRITLNEEDRGKFKVPSLRNVALTYPYMHDGSKATLEEVVSFFDRGGKDHPNKSELIKPLHLTEQEQKDIVSFLHTLTDKKFIERHAVNY